MVNLAVLIKHPPFHGSLKQKFPQVLFPAPTRAKPGAMASNFEPPCLDATDILSIGDKLGGKRIDNAIERARSSGIPQQGAQSGGYSLSYLHLSHIPLFPLYSPAQLHELAKIQTRKEVKLSYVAPPQRVNPGAKIAMMVVTTATGAANPLSVQKWENRLKGAGAVAMQKSMEQSCFIIFTRWALPPLYLGESEVIWFVDVLEWRGDSKRKGAQCYVKCGRRCKLEVLEQVVEVKENKAWSKRWMNFKYCETVALVTGEEKVDMEIVARVQRNAAGVEARTSLEGFEKEWVVPVVRM
jgi:hypothetical protein